MADERVGILIELEDPDHALETLKRVENEIRTLGKQKATITLNDGNVVTVAERIDEIRDKLAALSGSKGKKQILDHGEVKTAKELRGELNLLERSLKNATANAKTFGQVFNSISSKVAHVGSAMQSMGNALTRLTSPFRKLTTGLVMGAGYKALNLLTSGFSGAFERADIMSTYDKSLKALNLDAEQTFKVFNDVKTAKENLDEAVQGLPTGLDEIMAAQKVYAGATGEMVESTKLAIAANNSFLASNSDSRTQRFVQRYLSGLASGAELTTNQWESMFRTMPLVMRKVGEALGYEGKERFKEFKEEVMDGTIAGEDFLKTFEEIGTTGVVAKAARVQAMTWSGLASNITIATKRMGQNIIETLNETFKSKTGRSLLATLLGWDDEGEDLEDGIKHWINDISTSVQDWIKAHPEEIVGFFEKLKALDIKGFLKGVAEGMADVYKWGKGFVNIMSSIFGDVDLGKLGKRMVKLNALGSIFSIVGGLLKGGRHPIGLGGALGWLLGSKIKKGGIFGKIASLFGSKKAIQTAGETAKTIPTVTDSLRGAFSALQGLFTFAGAVLIVDTTIFATFKTVKTALKDLKDISAELEDLTWLDAVHGTEIIAGITVLAKVFSAIGEALGPQGLLYVGIAALAGLITGGAIAGMLWEAKQGVIQLKETILELDNVADAITNMKGIGTLDEGTKQKFRDTVASIAEVKRILNGEEYTGSIKEQGQTSPSLSKFDISYVDSMTNLADVINKLKDIVTQLNQLGAMKVVNNPATTIQSIKDACDKLQGVRAPKNIGKHTEEAAEALLNIKRMARRINALAETDINTSGFTALIEQLKEALQSLKDASGELELDITVKLGNTFQNSVHNCETAIKDAKKDIEKLKTPIRYNIPVTVTFSVTTNAWSAINKIQEARRNVLAAKEGNTIPSYNQATGGLIYRARGGGVPFRRRGTDTVPAMLTPGEYVHNKRAVSAFGIDFMRKVNNLDMKGAMNELMHRAGNMANVNRGTHITNNYNNNQKVIQNINTNSPDFAFRTASRFVGAF